MRRIQAARWLAVVMASTTTALADDRPLAAPRTLRLEECVTMAMRYNPDSLSSEDEVAGAEAARAGARGQLAPRVRADASVQRWSGPYEIVFPTGQSGPAPQAFPVRSALTWSAGVTVTQPLTPLWSLLAQYQAQRLGVDVAAIRRIETRRQIAFDVVQAYFRLLEAERLAEVAIASVTQLEAAERQAQSNYTNGVIAKNDLLRADLALATARQRGIQARGAVVLGRAQLAAAIGVAPDTDIDPVPFEAEPPALETTSSGAAEADAVAQRAEVRELRRRIEQAEAQASYAKSRLLPQVSAVGNYTHAEGSPFNQVDSAYVGLAGSWDVWDWGTTESGIADANARLRQARLAQHRVEDRVRLEARQALVNAGVARDGLGVARVAVSQAEENFRIVTKKFENAAATSFDLVDAEALVTQARGQVQTALYDFLIARTALQRATGAPLPGE